MDELWDIARVAEYLGVTERTVYNKVRAGDLPAVKVGRLWRVRPADLEAWLSGTAPTRAGASSPPNRARFRTGPNSSRFWNHSPTRSSAGSRSWGCSRAASRHSAGLRRWSLVATR